MSLRNDQVLNACLDHGAKVCIDSRRVERGDIFLALAGQYTNGHLFVEDALNRGAAYVVVEQDDVSRSDRVLRVPSVLAMVQEWAARRRRGLKAQVLAICGSNGKTSTKDLVAAMLGEQYKVGSTPGNWNNHLGVPLTLLGLKAEYDWAVVEIGVNHLGETATACQWVQPNFGLVTNVGRDHLGMFGSEQAVAQSHEELFDDLRERGGLAVVRADDPWMMQSTEGMKRFCFSCSSSCSFAAVSVRELDSDSVLRIAVDIPDLGVSQAELVTHWIGSRWLPTIAAAVSVGVVAGLPWSAMEKTLSCAQGSANRGERLFWSGHEVILDAYNANPSSVQAVLNDFVRMAGDLKVVVLGDMGELGDWSDEEHEQVILWLKQQNFFKVFVVGSCFESILKRCGFECDKISSVSAQQVRFWLEKQERSCQVLIKGSRHLALEKIVDRRHA